MKKIEDIKKKALYAALALVPAIASGVASNLQARSEAREEADDAREKAEQGSTSVLKSYEPVIAEIHKILGDNQLWVEGADADLDRLEDENAQLRADVSYCMAYIEFDSRGRSFRPERVPVEEDPDWRYKPPTPSKPKAKVPDTVQKAEKYIKAREAQKCAPGDPLCGASSL